MDHMGPGNGRRHLRRSPMQVAGGQPLPYDGPGLALPSSGGPQDRIYARPNQDYPEDVDLCFARGNSETRVRVAPADRPALFAAAGGLAPRLEELRRRARDLGDVNWEYHPGQLPRSAVDLVNAAHAAGYYLRCEDGPDASAAAEAARGHLVGLLAAREGEPGGMAHRDTEALERVIAMLDAS
jgi:hypothetical protein